MDVLQSDTCRPVSPSPTPRRAHPHGPATFDIGYISLEQQTPGIFDPDYTVASPPPAGHLRYQSTEAFPRNWFLRNAKQPGTGRARVRGFVFRQAELAIFAIKASIRN